MRVLGVFGVLAFGCTTVPAVAQDAQSLVAKNLEARGGAAAIAALNNVQFQGRIIFPGDFELTYKETRAQIDGLPEARLDLSLQGLDLVQAYDGHRGWKINPFQGRKDAEQMSADEARSLADSALIQGPLLSSRTDGSRVQYLGREDFDGTNAYKLKVTQKDGDEFVYWLDPDTFLEIKIDETRRVRGAQQTNETELGDYEKIAGVYFPMSIESWSQGQSNQRQRVMIASGTANGAIDPKIFSQPGSTTSGKPGGNPPDASQKQQGKDKKANDPANPSDDTTPSSSKGK